VNDHTYLCREGRWEIEGSTIDVAGNPNVMIGFVVVTHRDSWIVEEQLNEVQTRYAVAPLAPGISATCFTGANGMAGEVHGSLAFFDDLILSMYSSDDGHYHACEALRRLGDDRYENRGALFLDGGHVSSWSLTLRRVS
jgi:hypothetical protein